MSNINTPKKIVVSEKFECPTCGYMFNYAPRCPQCGQMVEYVTSKNDLPYETRIVILEYLKRLSNTFDDLSLIFESLGDKCVLIDDGYPFDESFDEMTLEVRDWLEMTRDNLL